MLSPAGILTRNWTLKVSAFGVALLLWIAVRAEVPNRQEIPGIPVRIDLADPQWTLAGEPSPSTVTVRFGGPSRELIRMAVDRPSLVIPMDQVTSSDTLVFLRASWVGVQDWPGVIAEDIQPASVRVTLEPVERVDRPLALRMVGELPDPLSMPTPPLIDPQEVRVTGPRSRLIGIDSVRLMPLDLSEVASSGAIQVGIDTTGLQGLQIQPPVARVELRVEDRIERVVSGIPVVLPEALRGDEALQTLPATGSVILRGARSVVERADPTTLEILVRVTESQLPPAGEVGEFPVVLIGLPPGLQGSPLQPAVTIENRGPPPP